MKILNFVIICILIIFTIFVLQYFIQNIPNIPTDENYFIQEIPNFLTLEECNQIRQISADKLIDSKVYSPSTDLVDAKVRISKQTWLNDNTNPLILEISKRIAKITKTKLTDQEELQVVNYYPGGFYKPHYDACNRKVEDCSRLNGTRGPRYITFIIYLNDNFEGGETHFPNINKYIVPEIGKAAIFYNVNLNGDVLEKSLHEGKDVKNGVKWIANKWIRNSNISS
jgi:prolyl 4-hydroxylase